VTYSLQQLSIDDLQHIAAGQPPAHLAHHLEPGALPPGFVATRALALLNDGHAEAWSCTYLIARDADERIVGGCGFKGPPKNGVVEIGYAIAPSAQGQGAATSAVHILLARAFSCGAQEVIAEVNPTNYASLRVVEKAGFSLTGARIDESNEYVIRWVKRSAA
jgi:ribosomal-protein-alanine N-acetyltransferase